MFHLYKNQKNLGPRNTLHSKASKKCSNKGFLTVQELKDAEMRLLKLTKQNLTVDKLDNSIFAKEDKDGVVRAHGQWKTFEHF